MTMTHTSNLVEANKVHVDRAKRRKAKFHASSHLCLQGARKPWPMLQISARGHRDVPFHHECVRFTFARKVGPELTQPRRGGGGGCACAL